jgi:two-component system phosphate regulon response regulator PhoB
MEGEQPLILIVDDDADIRSILRTKLEASGFRIAEAHDGQDAIDQCKRNRPALIIMDVRMPVMSGTEAVTAIKQDAELRDIKVVFLSNFGEEEEINAWLDQKYAREMGAMDYIKKTEDLPIIVSKITALLNG